MDSNKQLQRRRQQQQQNTTSGIRFKSRAHCNIHLASLFTFTTSRLLTFDTICRAERSESYRQRIFAYPKCFQPKNSLVPPRSWTLLAQLYLLPLEPRVRIVGESTDRVFAQVQKATQLERHSSYKIATTTATTRDDILSGALICFFLVCANSLGHLSKPNHWIQTTEFAD